MIKRLKQERYLGAENVYNTLEFITSNGEATIQQLQKIDGTPELIDSSREKVVSIGVQAPPNTQFSINGQTITMGKTGIFEWDVENIIGSYITSFVFLDNRNHNLQPDKTYIVDFCYLVDPQG